MSSPTPDGENEAATTALRTGAAQDGHPREKNARITYAGETDVFEGHIPQIQKSFSQQTFAFTRRNSLQSHSASFEKDAFVFVKLPPPDSGLKKRRSSTYSLFAQTSQVLSSELPNIFNLFCVHVVDDSTYLPKRTVFHEWLSSMGNDASSPFIAIIFIISEDVKVNKNTSKPACMEKVKSFYNFSKYYDSKMMYIFQSTSTKASLNFYFEVFIDKLKELIVAAVDSILGEAEDVLKKEWDQRSGSNWNIVSYLRSYENLMEFYKTLRLYQIVHESYLELKAYVEQVIINQHTGATSTPWLQQLLEEVSSWPGLALSDVIMTQRRGEIMNDNNSNSLKLSFLELQNLLFSNIFFQYLRAATSMDVLFTSSLDFITFTCSVLNSELYKTTVPSYVMDCWTYVSAISILMYCKNEANVNLFDFATNAVGLWEVARRALERLGKTVGLFSNEKQSSEKIQIGLDIMAGMEQSDDCHASIELRQALSSKSNYDAKYEELITMTISFYKHCGWMRYSCWKSTELGDFLVANNKFQLASKYYADAAEMYSDHKWNAVEISARTKLAACNQKDKKSEVEAVDVLASAISADKSEADRKVATKQLLSVNKETYISAQFVSQHAIRIMSLAQIFPVETSTKTKPSKSTDNQGVKSFQLSVQSCFPVDLQQVMLSWYYSTFDSDYFMGIVRGNQLKFVQAENPLDGASSDRKSDMISDDKTTIRRLESYTQNNLIENRLVKGGDIKLTIKPGTHHYQVDCVFTTAGMYRLVKVVLCKNKLSLEAVPEMPIDFLVRNIAPKVMLKDFSQLIYSHVKSKIAVIADAQHLQPKGAKYVLDRCTSTTADVELLSTDVCVESGGGENDGDPEAITSAPVAKPVIDDSKKGDDENCDGVEIEMEILTKALADFHFVSLHWNVAGTSKTVTSRCQIPSKRPLAIVPELLPAVMPPIMLLTAKNNSRSFLRISNFTLQHRSSTDNTWKTVALCGPQSEDKVPVSNGSRCCWTTQQGSLPMKDELKLSCEYKTDDYSEQYIPWRSTFHVQNVISSSKSQYSWMSISKEFYNGPSAGNSKQDSTESSSPSKSSVNGKPIDLFKEKLVQGRAYKFTFKVDLKAKKDPKLLYWVPSSAQWGMSGSHCRGVLKHDTPVTINVTARKPGDDVAMPEVIIRADNDITNPVDLVDTSEFRRVHVVAKSSEHRVSSLTLTPVNTSAAGIVLRQSVKSSGSPAVTPSKSER